MKGPPARSWRPEKGLVEDLRFRGARAFQNEGSGKQGMHMHVTLPTCTKKHTTIIRRREIYWGPYEGAFRLALGMPLAVAALLKRLLSNRRNKMTTFRSTMRVAAFTALALFSQAAWAAESMEVLKSASCGCCVSWGKHMREAGFTVAERNLPLADLNAAKIEAGLKPGQTSCHTARIAGYVIEGHVPAREVTRLLEERPDAIGLTVPDMPYGSPGMGKAAGDDADPYDVLLVKRGGTTEIYASYR